MTLPVSGRLNAVKPAAGEWLELLVPNPGFRAVGTVGACRTTSNEDAMYISLTTGGEPVELDMKVNGIAVPDIPPQLLGLVVGNGQAVYVKSDRGTVVFDFNGSQEVDI
jgi:hypothetical protein